MMKYEVLEVKEYYGNDLAKTYKAKLYDNGRLEPFPEIEYPDDDEEIIEPEDEEEDSLWRKS